MTDFASFGFCQPINDALAQADYVTPTPIQAQAIPHILAGRDLMGMAQTGTGKTAAFALPIIERLQADRRPVASRHCRVLVLSPTRELASQIADAFRTYGGRLRLNVAVILGGVSMMPQTRAMARGVDVLVATPGRLMDHMQQGTVRLDKVEVVVLDEVDRMLDMGFILPIRRILSQVPAERQSLFFSATMPNEIRALANALLKDPVEVAVTPVATTAEKVTQKVILVEGDAKRTLLVKTLADPSVGRVLVFTRTKHRADQVTRHLEISGIDAAAIHGNKSQGQRERALAGFRSGRTKVLVATDIAARGIDVDGITHVINFDVPNEPESYVHRIGRTARAGAAGIAISFCDQSERAYLRGIEATIRQRLATFDVEGNPIAMQPVRASRSAPPSRHRAQPQRPQYQAPRQAQTARRA